MHSVYWYGSIWLLSSACLTQRCATRRWSGRKRHTTPLHPNITRPSSRPLRLTFHNERARQAKPSPHMIQDTDHNIHVTSNWAPGPERHISTFSTRYTRCLQHYVQTFTLRFTATATEGGTLSTKPWFVMRCWLKALTVGCDELRELSLKGRASFVNKLYINK